MKNENTEPERNSESESGQQLKGRKPDYYINSVTGEGDEERWTQVGAAWQNEKGYITPKYDTLPRDPDRVVFQPRAELERLREERKNRHNLSQNVEISQ